MRGFFDAIGENNDGTANKPQTTPRSYWKQLYVIGKKWEEDLKSLRKSGALSKDEALSEGDVLEHLWDYMEEVDTFADEVYEDEEDEEE